MDPIEIADRDPIVRHVLERITTIEQQLANTDAASKKISIAALQTTLDLAIAGSQDRIQQLRSTVRRIDHLTKSLDNLWIQHEKHARILLAQEGDSHAHLEQPNPRRPARTRTPDLENASQQAADRDRHV